MRAVLSGFLLTLAAFAQDEDALRVHAKLYQRISPAVVGIRSGSQRGTGVIVNKEGWILTSLTATGTQLENVEVFLKGHKKVVGRVVERNRDLELALVRIDPKDVPGVMAIGDSDNLKIGALCYVLGDSYNSIFTDDMVAISQGHISGIYELKKVKGQTLYKGPVIETNAAVNPNSDGGVLVDGLGRAIGMITLNYHEAKFTGLAIPINRLKEALQKKMTGGPEIWLGFETEIRENELVVRKVSAKSPAERAGLKEGDVLLKLGDKEMKGFGDVEALLKACKAGQSLKAEIRRGKEKIDATLVVEERDAY
jgi:S1-C subfamily serine protease